MKSTHILRSLSALVLALLLLVSASACINAKDPSNDTDSAPESAIEAVTDDAETSEDDSEEETKEVEFVPEPDADLSADSAVIVLSEYAAEWEKTCADALSAELGIRIVDDKNAPSDKSLLIIGYAKENGDLSADVNTLGDLGYVIEANGGNVTILANTEAGLTSAVEALHGLLAESHIIPAATGIVISNTSESASVAYNGAWAENIDHAVNLANGISTHYLDVRRSIWRLSNQTVVLTYDMKKENCFTSITNANGIPYAINTGDVYLQREDGSRVYTSSSRVMGRTNTYQMGYYYYNAHILDQGFGLRNEDTGLHHFSVDRTFHMYSDKLNLVQHLTTTGGEATGLAGYGQQYRIDASRVRKMVAKDANGVHESFDSVDWSTCEYIGFDI